MIFTIGRKQIMVEKIQGRPCRPRPWRGQLMSTIIRQDHLILEERGERDKAPEKERDREREREEEEEGSGRGRGRRGGYEKK